MRKTVLVCALAVMCMLLAVCAAAQDTCTGKAVGMLDALLGKSRIDMAESAPFSGMIQPDAYNGISFAFGTGRVYVYGDGPSTVYLGVDDDLMAAAVPEVCEKWDELEKLCGNRPLLITVASNGVTYYADSAEDAWKLIRAFDLMLGTGRIKYVTVRTDANVRKEPGSRGERIGYVKAGSRQVAVNSVPDEYGNMWYKIEYENGYAYISESVAVPEGAK